MFYIIIDTKLLCVAGDSIETQRRFEKLTTRFFGKVL